MGPKAVLPLPFYREKLNIQVLKLVILASTIFFIELTKGLKMNTRKSLVNQVLCTYNCKDMVKFCDFEHKL